MFHRNKSVPFPSFTDLGLTFDCWIELYENWNTKRLVTLVSSVQENPGND